MPPSQRITPPNGALNRLCFPIQYTLRRSENASIKVYGRSQLLVCGAAISTLFAAWAGKAPSIFQPVARKVNRDAARRIVLTTGVSKMVWCMKGEAENKSAAVAPHAEEAPGVSPMGPMPGFEAGQHRP